MDVTEKQKRHLRAMAHRLKPVVTIGGAGMTDAVVRELDLSLAHHELLKVRVNAADRQTRTALIKRLCEASGSTLVQSIGHIAVLYRPAEPPHIALPR